MSVLRSIEGLGFVATEEAVDRRNGDNFQPAAPLEACASFFRLRAFFPLMWGCTT